MDKLKLRRRQFFLSLFASAAPMPALKSLSSDEPETLHVPEEIRRLEDQLRNSPDGFSWNIHNELRHLYGPISENKSRLHADAILRHSLMDDYVLNTLSDWHLTNEHNAHELISAIALLLDNAERYQHFPHLWAACLIKAGDTYGELQQRPLAEELYRRVLNSSATSQPYRLMAQYRLKSESS